MKVVFVFLAFVAAALCAPQYQDPKSAVILRQDASNIGVDGYSFGYETSNGISQQESGQLQNAGSENEAIAVRGQFAYTDDSGTQYVVNYVADENGFQPEGAHLPKA